LAAVNDGLVTLPEVSKADGVLRRDRIAHFLEHGSWPPPPPHGARIEFDPVSIVGGDFHPFGMGARYLREGDEAVGYVTLGTCFEGPPGRAHGGVICAVFDEVMGSVFRATGTASAFTGELTVRFLQPAPLGTELEFRARQVDTEGRKRFLEGEARSPEGPFAKASAIFIEMTADHFSK
jgi:acyl-coenzyme A thioesterase PaaI-like protein